MVVFLLLIAAVPFSASDNSLACKGRPDLVGECRVIHGRLMFYNGTPSFRIWVVGTHRLLGVQEIKYNDNPERPLMPESIWKKTGGDEYELYADFDVCPLTTQRPGWMQMVCVESAQHVVSRTSDGIKYNDKLR